jgi:hypothetical protein
MMVFISHLFQNKPEFENIVDALEQRGVPYWNPVEIKPGASLREQLRVAVDRCDVCIFVARRDSIESKLVEGRAGSVLGGREASYRVLG